MDNSMSATVLEHRFLIGKSDHGNNVLDCGAWTPLTLWAKLDLSRLWQVLREENLPRAGVSNFKFHFLRLFEIRPQ